MAALPWAMPTSMPTPMSTMCLSKSFRRDVAPLFYQCLGEFVRSCELLVHVFVGEHAVVILLQHEFNPINYKALAFWMLLNLDSVTPVTAS